MRYVLYLDWAALVVFLIIFINMRFKKTIRTGKSDMFRALLIMSCASTVLDIASARLIECSAVVPLWLNYPVNMLYFLTLNVSAPIFLEYVLALTGKLQRFPGRRRLLLFVPYALSALMILTSPLTHAVFYFDADGSYSHGAMLYLLYVIAEGYLLVALAHTIANRRVMTPEQAVSSCCFLVGSMAAVLIQMLVPGLLITQFAAAVTILLIYMTLQNPEDFFDSSTGAFNRRAFLTVFAERAAGERPIDIAALRVYDIDYLSHTLGSENADNILKLVITQLQSLTGDAMLFKISHTKYAFLAEHDRHIFDSLPGQIEALFSRPFDYDGLSISLSAPLCCISYPEIAKGPDEALSMIEYYLEVKAVDSLGSGSVMWAEKQVLEGHAREEDLLNQMREALVGGGFYVVYQPIFSVADGEFTDAEALVRLKTSPELGYVSPEEFIPLAEKNGLITQIGELVVRQVCEFLAESKPAGLRHVNVNLSVVQCMQEELHERLIGVIDSCGLNHELISFEITETSAAYSSEVLRNNMNRLIAQGFEFALDDYGSGFSGTGYLIDYPFSIVKLDKHIVWEAFKRSRAMSVLKHTVSMIREMGLCLVAEGVETQAQAQTLSAMGVDLLQGYLYSRPISPEELISFLERS